MKSHIVKKKSSLIQRYFWLLLGLTFSCIGMIGIVVPGLPTTIFMILAIGCFYRSSQRLYNWVINHKIFGQHVRNYIEDKGMPKKAKYSAFLLMWTFVIFAVTFAIPGDMVIVKAIILIAAATGSGYIYNLRTIQ